MATKHTLGVAVLAFGCAVLATAFVSATASPAMARDRIATNGADAFAQVRRKAPRARTRLRVYRGYPYRHEATPYPVPYPIEYPGPGFVRQCTARLVAENRPSGSVIVPVTRCWWERG